MCFLSVRTIVNRHDKSPRSPDRPDPSILEKLSTLLQSLPLERTDSLLTSIHPGDDIGEPAKRSVSPERKSNGLSSRHSRLLRAWTSSETFDSGSEVNLRFHSRFN